MRAETAPDPEALLAFVGVGQAFDCDRPASADGLRGPLVVVEVRARPAAGRSAQSVGLSERDAVLAPAVAVRPGPGAPDRGELDVLAEGLPEVVRVAVRRCVDVRGQPG